MARRTSLWFQNLPSGAPQLFHVFITFKIAELSYFHRHDVTSINVPTGRSVLLCVVLLIKHANSSLLDIGDVMSV